MTLTVTLVIAVLAASVTLALSVLSVKKYALLTHYTKIAKSCITQLETEFVKFNAFRELMLGAALQPNETTGNYGTPIMDEFIRSLDPTDVTDD